MKQQSVNIRIPDPCSKAWGNMSSTAQGAHCNSCETEVIDFSRMSDRQLIDYLSTHKFKCGRFRQDQINTPLSFVKPDNGFMKWKALLFGLLPFFGVNEMMAAGKSAVAMHQTAAWRDEAPDTARHPQVITISGVVRSPHGRRLSRVDITISDRKNLSDSVASVTTDRRGRFSVQFTPDPTKVPSLHLFAYYRYASTHLLQSVDLTTEPSQQLEITLHKGVIWMGCPKF